MSLSQNFKRTAVASAIFVALGQGAEAAIINAEVDYTVGATTGSDVDGPATSGFVDVLAGVDDYPNSSSGVFYHTYGSTTGSFGSRVSGRGTYDITGIFTYSDVITNTSTGVLGYSFDYTVTAGELELSGNPLLAGEFLFAEYNIDILVNGSSVWSSAASLSQNAGDAAASFSESGSSLGGILSGGTNFDLYSWGNFTNILDLGTLASGESMTFEYILTSHAVGNISDETCYGGADYGFDGAEAFIYNDCGSIARSGDPFRWGTLGNQNTGVINVSQVTTSVPEPSGLLLMGAGLAGLAGTSRRRRKA